MTTQGERELPPLPEREHFEAWAKPILGDNPTWRESADCELAWQAWQAGRVLSFVLSAQGRQAEPVAWRAWFDQDNGARWLFTLWPEEERLDVTWEPLYAAPSKEST